MKRRAGVAAPRGAATDRGCVELIDVARYFGPVAAVDGIDLRVEPGEFLSLLGPSGCGKTTTLRLLAGFEHPDRGQIIVSGDAVGGVPPYKRDINTVFQSYSLFPHMTVAENIAYGLRQRRTPRSEIGLLVTDALDMVQMRPMADRKPQQLSGGQQQRVALARALVNRPSVLLLDEPLGALDRKLREEMQVELKLLQTELKTTFVFVTHDQQEALAMSDRIVVMRDGHIEQCADPSTVYEDPATAFVAGFLGQQNFFEGTAADRGQVVRSDGVTLHTSRTVDAVTDGAAAVAAVRPESVSMAGGSASGSINSVAGVVASRLHLGDAIEHVVMLADGRKLLVRGRRADGLSCERGDAVVCSWDAPSVRIFAADQAATMPSPDAFATASTPSPTSPAPGLE